MTLLGRERFPRLPRRPASGLHLDRISNLRRVVTWGESDHDTRALVQIIKYMTPILELESCTS